VKVFSTGKAGIPGNNGFRRARKKKGCWSLREKALLSKKRQKNRAAQNRTRAEKKMSDADARRAEGGVARATSS